LEGKRPHLIDEWQKYPEVWDAAKTSVDKENKGNLYILTGSSAPKKGTTVHTGSMRIAKVTMSTLSLLANRICLIAPSPWLLFLLTRSKTLPLPRFLAVITDEGMAYRREDGVYVIPVGCLTV
jgi:hypothetical protein